MHKLALSVMAGMMLSLIATPMVNAQDSESGLLGSWTLSVEDSDFAPDPAPDSLLMKIERADDQLVMRRELHYSQLGGVRTIMFDMPTDGGTYDATTNYDDGVLPMTVSWDGADLVLISEIEVNIGLIEVIDRYSASSDGQELIMERLMDIPNMGIMESTMVFLRDD
ncbi:MAG: hypothetical protein V3S56_09795 [Gemmatimonadota bacterium]